MITRYEGTDKIADVSVGGDSLQSEVQNAVDKAISEALRPHLYSKVVNGWTVNFHRMANIVVATFMNASAGAINNNTKITNFFPTGYRPGTRQVRAPMTTDVAPTPYVGEVYNAATNDLTFQWSTGAGGSIPSGTWIAAQLVYITDDPMPD